MFRSDFSTKANDILTTYWAVILKSATVIFQEIPAKEIKKDEEVTPIEEWYESVKAKFSMGMYSTHLSVFLLCSVIMVIVE